MGRLTREQVGDPPAHLPKYRWLKSVLLDHIDNELSIGDPVPSERELAEELDVSRMTARRALDELTEEGRLHREIGRGTFVASPTIRLPLQLTSFSHDMRERGAVPGARTLWQRVVRADEQLAAAMGISPGMEVVRLVRLRTADGVPMAIERAHLLYRFVPGLAEIDITDRSLYEVLADQYSIVFDGGEQLIGARLAGDEDAGLLGIEPSLPVLHLQRISSWRGTVVEYTVSAYRADRYVLAARIAP